VSLRYLLLLGLISIQNSFSQNQNSGQNTTSVQTPVLGFLFDSLAHRIRPLQGVPGAALLSAPLDAGVEIAAAVLSPRQDYTLILSGDERAVELLRFRPNGLLRQAIDGVTAAPDGMYLSPSGSAAGLYYQTSGTVQIITGLPDAPVLAREVGVAASGLNVSAIALSDDGQVLIAAVDDNPAILVSGADGSLTSVALGNRVQALAFRPHTQDAAAAAGNTLVLLPNITQSPQPVPVAGTQDGIAGPTAVAFSNDGQRLFAANAGNGTVTVSDLALGNTAAMDCGCHPTGLYRLTGEAVFRLTEMPDPLLLFDGTTNPPRILFVPPDQASGNQGSEQ